MNSKTNVNAASAATECYPPGHPCRQIIEEMAAMSGFILWRVKATWANNGRVGEIDMVVEARDDAGAIKRRQRKHVEEREHSVEAAADEEEDGKLSVGSFR